MARATGYSICTVVQICIKLYILYIHIPLCHYRFLFNNQPDTLIIQISSVIKLYMFRAPSLPIIRSFSTVHSVLVSFMQVLMAASKQRQDGTLSLLGSGHQNLHENYQCQMYSRKLLMMGREVAQNMQSFMAE